MKNVLSLFVLGIVLILFSCNKDEDKTCVTCTINAFIVELTSEGCVDGNDVKVKTTESFLGTSSDTIYKNITLEEWKADRVDEGYSCK
ncbi:MAG: hypothetical protein IPN49_03345 [Saprospiraceae bacterium]|nr:hypothetical protein [Saprospiraceae bacterium]